GQLGREAPLLALHPRREEHVDHVGLGRSHLDHAAHRAPEEVGRLLGVGAGADPQVARSQLDVTTVATGRTDERHDSLLVSRSRVPSAREVGALTFRQEYGPFGPWWSCRRTQADWASTPYAPPSVAPGPRGPSIRR